MTPQILKLSISSPQPRLNEIFHLTLDFTDLKAVIFGDLVAEIEPKKEAINLKNEKKQVRIINMRMLEKTAIRLNKIAIEKGEFEAGPLAFELNGTKYTTNKISYEVIDSLPDVDNGLWIRKIVVDEKTVCIIIEQRTPAKEIRTKTKNGTTHVRTEPQDFQFVKLNAHYPNAITGLVIKGGHSGTGFFNNDGRLIDGKKISYNHNYSISYFEIIDPKANIKVTKENFENIPGNYDFEDIVVQ